MSEPQQQEQEIKCYCKNCGKPQYKNLFMFCSEECEVEYQKRTDYKNYEPLSKEWLDECPNCHSTHIRYEPNYNRTDNGWDWYAAEVYVYAHQVCEECNMRISAWKLKYIETENDDETDYHQ